MFKQDKLIFLGVISAAHGIKGEVLVKAFNADPEKLAEMEIVDEKNNPIKLTFVRRQQKKGSPRKGSSRTSSTPVIVARVVGCNNRNDAEKLVRRGLYCRRDALPAAVENEFYISDLVGLEVLDQENKPVGTVSAIFNFGAGDIIEIKMLESGKKEMFPFTKEIFPEIRDDCMFIVKAL